MNYNGDCNINVQMQLLIILLISYFTQYNVYYINVNYL